MGKKENEKDEDTDIYLKLWNDFYTKYQELRKLAGNPSASPDEEERLLNEIGSILKKIIELEKRIPGWKLREIWEKKLMPQKTELQKFLEKQYI